MDTTNTRGQFSNKLGFVLAAAGSSVGLGNIWRFPYYTAKYGGAAFILVYVLVAVTIGFTLVATEIAIGRKTSLSPIPAYRKLCAKFAFLGLFADLAAAIITPYYSVIGGWVIKYFKEFLVGNVSGAASDGFFGEFISGNFQPALYLAIFTLLGGIVIFGGVEKGIEKVNKIMMPTLVVMIVGLSIYGLTLPGAMEGLEFLLVPDFSKITPMAFIAATGQMFYSLSIAMGILVTYGSYMQKKDDLAQATLQIEIFDTAVAILAAVMIIPPIFAVSPNMAQDLSAAGPGLMFVTLPKLFAIMPGGRVVGAFFFFLVLLAALTSSISLMEAILSPLVDGYKISRNKAATYTIGWTFVIGMLSVFGYGIWSDFTIFGLQILDFMDFISNYVLMPITAFGTAILIGWILGPKTVTDEIERSSETFRRKPLYNFTIRYLVPVATMFIMVMHILATFGVVTL